MNDNQPTGRQGAGAERSPKLRLDELLLARGLAETRTQAQRLIMAGQVSVGDKVADKPGLQVARDAPVRVQAPLRYVSRGGLKLEAALDAFGLDPSGCICADIGASTGGFTDCLLQRGARRVYAVDVGYGQLAWSLRVDSRVICIERTNIRHLAALPEPVSLATVDVSFIGLALVFPRIRLLLAPAGQTVVLIKPQFEVGKGQVGKGGVVRDPDLHRTAVARVLGEAMASGLMPAGVMRSPIKGPAGNVEFLAWLRLGGDAPASGTLAAWVEACIG
jgi:23S rRNA (cytidine1920-2'-O)/16S rRNA (cytidine1409-2'-O)-methyltransferase